MKLTVLGCWAPYPAAGGACSGYLIQAGGKNILLDCGNGVLSNLQKYIDFRLLDLVLISHLHPDHHHDLYCLRHAIAGARRREKSLEPIPLYLPEAPSVDYEKIRLFDNAYTIKSIESLPSLEQYGVNLKKLDFGEIKISFVPVSHSLPGYGILLEEERKFFYTGDTKWVDYMPDIASGADMILSEASIIEEDKAYASVGHLTAREAGELGKRAGTKKLVLSHFWPEYDLQTLKREAESTFGERVLMAVEGLEVEA